MAKKGVNVVRAGNSFAAVAAARATQQIPVVFFYVDNPVERGFVDSLGRPGRNLTGFTHNTGIDHFTKRVQVLRELTPSARRLAWLWMLPGDDTTTVSGAAIDHRSVITSVAKAQGFESRFHDIRRLEDVAPALAQIAAWPADAMASAGFPLVPQARQPVVDFALRRRLPSLIDDPATIDAGGLCSYEIAPSELTRMAGQCAGYVDRILRGARPADLPVVQPSRFELLVNLKTARAIGLPIAQSVLLRTDRLIE